MSPPWEPNADGVKDSEVIARRIFTDRIYEKDNRYRVDHFFDSRLDNDLSVDRLGEGGPQKKVKRRLCGIVADEHKNQSFAGWIGLKCGSLRIPKHAEVEVKATAKDNNPYHADICRNEFRASPAAYSLALRLRDLATRDYPEVILPE